MAEDTVRKSGRIKVRNTSYLDDDFDFNLGKFDHEDEPLPKKKKTSKQKPSQDKPSVKLEINKKKSLTIIKVKNDTTDCISHTTNSIKGDEETKRDVNEQKDKEDKEEEWDKAGDEPNSLACPLCAQKLKGSSELASHIESHRVDNPAIQLCQVCCRVCVDAASFTRHMRTHTGDRKFKCDECGKAFLESCSLKRHKKSHGNERPFVCSICFKGFRDSSSFTRHQRTHSSQPRVYNCDLCDKNFMDKHGLKRHRRTHLNVRPFQCSICSKSFGDSCSFKRHQKIHTGIRDFHCWNCKKSFLEKQSLKRHMKNVCGFDGYHDENSSDSSSMNLSQLSMTSVNKKLDFKESHNSLLKDADVFKEIHQTLGNASKPKDVLSLQQKVKLEPSCDDSIKSETDPSSPIVSFPPPPKPPTSPLPLPQLSLGRLINRDPSLYTSITGLVDSIDSFEKMMTLVSEKGEEELEDALAREPAPMPDNLLCFECGEPLIDGDNFNKEGKDFSSTNSFKCSSCEPPDLQKTSFVIKEELQELDPSEKLLSSEEEDNDLIESSNSKSGPVSPACSENQIPAGLLYQNLMASYEKAASLAFKQTGSLLSSMFSDQKDIKPPPLDYSSDDPGAPSVFPCHLCDKVFASSIFRNQHLKLHKLSPNRYKTPPQNSTSPYECITCFKTFTNSAGLKRHSMIHLEEKPYKCKTCGRSFSDRSNFTKHKRRCAAAFDAAHGKLMNSTKDTNSVLQDPCDQTFEESSSLENHKKKCCITMGDQAKPSKKSNESVSISFNYDSVDINDDDNLPVYFMSSDKTDSSIDLKSTKPKITNGENQIGNPFIKQEPLSVKEEPLSPNNEPAAPFDNSGRITCDICDKTFQTQKSLVLHMNFHTKDPKVTCSECGKSFFDTFGLKRHMRTHANIRPFICVYCGRGYCDNWSLKKHGMRGCQDTELKDEVDRSELHPCPQCSRVFTTAGFLEDHMATHKGQLKFECDICEKKFSEAFNLKRHRRLHMAVCPGCDGEFRDLADLQQHQAGQPDGQCRGGLALAEDGVDGFPCAQCGRTFSTKAYLERHKKFHSGLKPFACQICGKRFSESFGLKRHMRTHANRSKSSQAREEQKISSRSTKTEPNIDIKSEIDETVWFNPELQENTPVKSLSKKENIKVESSQLDPSLKAMILVTKYGAFECGVCTKTFLKKYMLVRHLSVHSEDRKFSCSVCGKAYKDSSSLRRHQLIHKGVKEFVCSQCGKDFCYPDSLRRHLKGSCGKGMIGNPKTAKRLNGSAKESTYGDCQLNLKQSSSPSQSRSVNSESSILKTLMAEPLKPLKIKMWSKSPKNCQEGIFQSTVRKTSPWSCQNKNRCWQCHSKFSSTEQLIIHSKSHKGQFPLKCSHCYLKFTHKYYWMSHKKKCRYT